MLKYFLFLLFLFDSFLGIGEQLSDDKKDTTKFKQNKFYGNFYLSTNLTNDSISKKLDTKRNVIFIEAFGNSIWGSINYSRIWYWNEKFQFSPSIGLFYSNKEEKQITNLTRTPINIRFLYGRKTKLEFGACFTPELRWTLINKRESLSYYDKYMPEKYYFLLNIGVTQLFLNNWIASARVTPFYYNHKGASYTLYGGVFIGKLF